MEWGEGFQDFITELVWLFEAFLSSAEAPRKHIDLHIYQHTGVQVGYLLAINYF